MPAQRNKRVKEQQKRKLDMKDKVKRGGAGDQGTSGEKEHDCSALLRCLFHNTLLSFTFPHFLVFPYVSLSFSLLFQTALQGAIVALLVCCSLVPAWFSFSQTVVVLPNGLVCQCNTNSVALLKAGRVESGSLTMSVGNRNPM